MQGSYYGLLGATIGATAVPGRRIPTLAVTNPVGAVTAVVAVTLLSILLIALAHAIDHLPHPQPHDDAKQAQPLARR